MARTRDSRIPYPPDPRAGMYRFGTAALRFFFGAGSISGSASEPLEGLEPLSKNDPPPVAASTDVLFAVPLRSVSVNDRQQRWR